MTELLHPAQNGPARIKPAQNGPARIQSCSGRSTSARYIQDL